jgi:hypothetical protein
VWTCHASEPLTCTQQQSAKSKHQCQQCQHQSCSQRDRVPVQQAPTQHPACLAKCCLSAVSSANSSHHWLQPSNTYTVTSRLHCFCQHLLSTCVYHWLQGNGNGCMGQATVFNSLQVCDNSYLPTRATSSLVFPTSVELDCDYSYWAGPPKSLHHLLCLRCGVQGGVADRPAISGDLDYSLVWCAGSYQCGTSGQVLWTQASGGLDHPVRS